MTILSFVLPPVLGYFVVAWLAVTPQTHVLRMALWLVVMFFALRAAVCVDMSFGDLDTRYFNIFFVACLIIIVTRTFDWSLEKEPLSRPLHPDKSSRSTLTDALDLATNLRGQGWGWSKGMYIPRETRPTSRGGFILHVILSATFHAILTGVLHTAIRSFSPTGLGSPSGGSIIDETLPFFVRYFRASVITALATITAYAAVQAIYDICTTVGVLVFGNDPAQWPPAFDAPWLATSLSDFWGRRWHQFFRRTFLISGGYPLSLILGKAGLVIGSFLSSGVLHHIIIIASANDQLEPWRIIVGFGTMALGVVAEQGLLRPLMGRKVGGVVGWVWVAGWFIVAGTMLVDAFARGGVFRHMRFLDCLAPRREVVHDLVVNFDAWLHTV